MRRDYNDKAYEKFRKEVIRRDKARCQMPGCNSKNQLQVHHIKTWAKASSLRYEPTNGITLCKKCHKSITNKENHYEKLFREIIDGKV
tara:strand:- start:2552 stop:2815 length:264 start_codon:yes stop_codon:yes gene_type:complete